MYLFIRSLQLRPRLRGRDPRAGARAHRGARRQRGAPLRLGPQAAAPREQEPRLRRHALPRRRGGGATADGAAVE